MPAHPSCSLVAVALAALVTGPAAAPADERHCQADGANLNLFLDREAIIASHERLSDHCLKALFRECSNAAQKAMLDGGAAAMCSIRYEALLRRSFGGDFPALLGWWQGEAKETGRR